MIAGLSGAAMVAQSDHPPTVTTLPNSPPSSFSTDAFAHVRQLHLESAHDDTTSRIARPTRSGPGTYDHSCACGYGVSQPHTRVIGVSRW